MAAYLQTLAAAQSAVRERKDRPLSGQGARPGQTKDARLPKPTARRHQACQVSRKQIDDRSRRLLDRAGRAARLSQTQETCRWTINPISERAANRLRVILNNRRAACQNWRVTSTSTKSSLSCFKQILNASAARAGRSRANRSIASFRNAKLRKRGMKMIALLEKEVPELCQLEQEWLNSLKRQKVSKGIIAREHGYSSMSDRYAGEDHTASSGGSSWGTWLIWVFVAKLIIGLIGALLSDK